MPFDLSDLMERTPSPPMHVELAQVVSDGRRLKTRHRLRVTVASVGVLALLGAVGTFEASNHDQTTPASTLRTGSVTVPLNKNLFSFRVDAAGRVHFGRVVQGTNRVVSEVGATPVNGQAWVIPKDRPNVVLGVVPDIEEASHIDAVVEPLHGGFAGSAEEDLASGLKAYAREFSNARDAAAYRGRVFTDVQGRIHGPGGVLPMATLPSGNGGAEQVSVWLDSKVEIFGLLSRGQLSMRVDAVTASGGSVQDAANATSVRVYGILPAGATGVHVTFGTAVNVVAPLRTNALGSDWVAFYTEYGSATNTTVRGTVVWGDSSGQGHTQAAD
ncbi:MAG TPA: hypothetical protein VFM86_14620 [Pedococcus sp.]|nr:hypothetical protein [Pedococcus sp.]